MTEINEVKLRSMVNSCQAVNEIKCEFCKRNKTCKEYIQIKAIDEQKPKSTFIEGKKEWEIVMAELHQILMLGKS